MKDQEEIIEENELWREKCKTLEGQLTQQDVMADQQSHIKDMEVKRMKAEHGEMAGKVKGLEEQIQRLTEQKDDVERRLDIKTNEVAFYKGELERFGIESDYESVAGDEGPRA